jgi:hypothetical protein
MKSNETQLVKAALDYLRLCGFTAVWRNNTGAMVREYKGKTRFTKFGVPGISDIIGCAPDGRFFAAEAKVGDNKTTLAQRSFINEVRLCDGVAFAFWSLEELQVELVDAGYKVVGLA